MLLRDLWLIDCMYWCVYCCCCSPDRQLIRKPAPQVFDEARPLIVSGAKDKGLEPDPDEPTGDELQFPERPTDIDKQSRRISAFSVIPCRYIILFPRDGTQSAAMPSMSSVCLSVRPSVTFRYRDHTGWNTLKIISWPNSLRYLLTLTLISAIWSCRNTPKIRVE